MHPRTHLPNKSLLFLFLIVALVLDAPPLGASETSESAADVLVYDLSRTNQIIDGFGTQIWAGQEAGIAGLEPLGFKYIRITKDGSTWAQLRELRKETDRLGIRWVYNLWSAPEEYRRDGMLGDVSGFSVYWKDLVAELDRQGVRPHFIDLMNEPDSKGEWSTGISPEDLNRLVKETRSRLDASGYSDVGIVGPGLSSFGWSDTPAYMAAFDEDGIEALAAWANHTWDDGTTCHGGASCLERLWEKYGTIAARRAPKKPIWITEYATKEFTFHGVDYPNPDKTEGYSSAHTMPYAVRVFENTLALLNLGGNTLIYWSAQDSQKSWGYVDPEGRKKPVYYTLRSLCPKLPRGTRVVQPPEHAEEGVYSGAFLNGDRVVVGLANDGTEEKSVVIHLTNGAKAYRVLSAEGCLLDRRGDPAASETDVAKVVEPNVRLTGGSAGSTSFQVTLPADSTLTVELEAE